MMTILIFNDYLKAINVKFFYFDLIDLKNNFIHIFFSEIGFEWVGWSNDSVGVAGKPIELTFQFDTVRNFSAMILHTNNMFSKGVQVSYDF